MNNLRERKVDRNWNNRSFRSTECSLDVYSDVCKKTLKIVTAETIIFIFRRKHAHIHRNDRNQKNAIGREIMAFGDKLEQNYRRTPRLSTQKLKIAIFYISFLRCTYTRNVSVRSYRVTNYYTSHAECYVEAWKNGNHKLIRGINFLYGSLPPG